MAGASKIEWTDATWNPIVGCSIVSPGCTNCYAMRIAPRTDDLSLGCPTAGPPGRLTKNSNAGPVWTGSIRLVERRLPEPLRWRKPRMIFVNSMGDLFHESIPDEWIDRVFAVMALCPQHTFQVLTKRAERMRRWLDGDRADCVGLAMLTIVDRIPYGHRCVPWPLPNVWLGISAERQQEASERIPQLMETPAAIRFVSFEPLIGPVSLRSIPACDKKPSGFYDLGYEYGPGFFDTQSRRVRDCRLDWVIVGGESGRDARPMHPQWARDLRDQCVGAGVPFFFKQWGEYHPSNQHDDRERGCKATPVAIHVGGRREYRPFEAGELIATRAPGWAGMCKLGKKAAGRLLDGREHNEFPQAREALAA